jgi:hypothetical protein
MRGWSAFGRLRCWVSHQVSSTRGRHAPKRRPLGRQLVAIWKVSRSAKEFQSNAAVPKYYPMRDGIAKPWVVISPSAGPAASGAFSTAPIVYLAFWLSVSPRSTSSSGKRHPPCRLSCNSRIGRAGRPFQSGWEKLRVRRSYPPHRRQRVAPHRWSRTPAER